MYSRYPFLDSFAAVIATGMCLGGHLVRDLSVSCMKHADGGAQAFRVCPG